MTLREHLLSATDAGKMLGLSTVRINVLLNQGRFEGAEKIGNYWVIPREAVENFKRLPPGGRKNLKQQHREDAEMIAQALAEIGRGRE